MSGAEGATEASKLVEGNTYTPLLKSEGGMDYSEYPGTTTLTFFEGDLATALPLLSARLMEILRANPWLVGRFIKNKDHENWQLRYPAVVTEEHLNELLIHRQEEIGDGFPNISFREMATKLCPLKPNLIVSPGSALLNKDIPCSRFTVFPSPTPDGSGKAGFCLVASISHSAADGHTYYEILNMLAPAAEVWPFKVERRQDFFPELLNQSLGKEEQGWMMSCSLITSVTCSIMCGCKGQARQLAFEVDEAKVAKMKEEALQRNTSDPSLQVPFVSTNDILTSHFGIVSGQRIMMMAMDLRGRVPGVGRKDAGCYTARLVLDPKSFEDPRGIRKSLLGEKEGEFRRASNEPGELPNEF